MNAKIVKEAIYRKQAGDNSLHDVSNDNGKKMKNFAASKDLIISTKFDRKEYTQIDMAIARQ